MEESKNKDSCTNCIHNISCDKLNGFLNLLMNPMFGYDRMLPASDKMLKVYETIGELCLHYE